MRFTLLALLLLCALPPRADAADFQPAQLRSFPRDSLSIDLPGGGVSTLYATAHGDLLVGYLMGGIVQLRGATVTGFRVAHKTGDFLPYIANDVGIFESDKRNIVVSVFTAGH